MNIRTKGKDQRSKVKVRVKVRVRRSSVIYAPLLSALLVSDAICRTINGIEQIGIKLLNTK